MTNTQLITVDMGNLLICDTQPMPAINNDTIVEKAKEELAMLVKSLYDLKSSQKHMELNGGQYEVELPDKIQTFPRLYPLPKPKPETRWDKFKKLKGIKKPTKRSRLVYDDKRKDWAPRWGKGSVKKLDKKDNWITED
jgi:regulator of ribosome biosynthesis